MVYYNENDPFCVDWLRALIARGLIAPGYVDERSIADVSARDLDGFAQCHWFAGIGVWSYALRLSGWSDARPVWTGSAPCQPHSRAGERQADADVRHLAPHWVRLIGERRPRRILGEQVSGAIGNGWLDDLFVSLEHLDYACGAAVFPACSVGAPHIRERLYFLADAAGEGRATRDAGAEASLRGFESARVRGARALGDADGERSQGSEQPQLFGARRRGEGRAASEPGASFWSGCEWVRCADGKARAIEPGTFPLAHGSARRVGRLRGYGNALVAQQAQAFIESVMQL